MKAFIGSYKKAFTLVEIMVAISIFSLIIVSVFSIFLVSSGLSGQIELSRVLQENVKNAFEDISEKIRVEDIVNIAFSSVQNCDTSALHIGTGTKLCIGKRMDSGTNLVKTEYYVARKISGIWTGIDTADMATCADVDENEESICRLVKSENGEIHPLTNNLVAVENIEFRVSNSTLPRVDVYLKIRPSFRSGISPEAVLQHTLQIQTTFSERVISNQ